MGLIDRLQPVSETRASGAQPSLFSSEAKPGSASTPITGFLADMRTRVQDRLVQRIDVTRLEEAGYSALLEQIGEVIDELITEDKVLITGDDRAHLIKSVTNDMLGLGTTGIAAPRQRSRGYHGQRLC